jgi:hypothetical protein
LWLLHRYFSYTYLKTHREMKAGVEEGQVGENTKQGIHNLYLFWIVYTPAEGSS